MAEITYIVSIYRCFILVAVLRICEFLKAKEQSVNKRFRFEFK